jgi:argininosuccinate lyase
VHLGRSRNDQVLTAIRLYLRDAIDELGAGAAASPTHSIGWRAREGHRAPGYTHMQQAMPSSVPLWAGGFAPKSATMPKPRRACTVARGRIRWARPPATARRGCRSIARPPVGNWAIETQEPVTAVQLSRGKAESQLLFEITLLMQDLGRFAADVLLFYTQEFGFVELPEAFTTGSSIMPQKRNPDVFELIRGRSASAQACLTEALASAPSCRPATSATCSC